MAESMSGQILAIARTMTKADESEQETLAMLCAAQEEALEKRLRDGVSKEACASAFICAPLLGPTRHATCGTARFLCEGAKGRHDQTGSYARLERSVFPRADQPVQHAPPPGPRAMTGEW